MVKLPGGLSPIKAIQQAGSLINPTGGVADYNVFSDMGSNKTPAQIDAGNMANMGYGMLIGNPNGNTGGANEEQYSGSAGGGTSYSSADLQNIALYQQAIDQANAGMGRLDNQQNIGLGNVNTDYQNNLQRLLNAKNKTQSQYEGNKIESTKENLGARSDIDFATGQRANSLQRLLGSRGAGSSSASRTAAPYAAALEGTQQLRQVGDAFSKNMGALDTSWDNYQGEWSQSKDDLEAQKVNQERAVQSDVAGKRATLLSQIAQLQAQKAQAAGGNGAAAAQPYLEQVNGLYGQIDNLGSQYAGKVKVADPTYKAPDLSGYNYDARSAVQVGDSNALTESVNPYLSVLLGAKKKQANQIQA